MVTSSRATRQAEDRNISESGPENTHKLRNQLQLYSWHSFSTERYIDFRDPDLVLYIYFYSIIDEQITYIRQKRDS